MPSAALPPFDLRAFGPRDTADPYPVYRRYREAAPVHRGAGPRGGPETFYVFGHEEVVRVLSGRLFGRDARAASPAGDGEPVPIPAEHRALRSIVENWLVFLDPPRHTALRSLLGAEFTPSVVTGLRPRIGRIAQELLQRLVRHREADLVEHFAAPFPILVISELLGIPAAHHGWLRANALALQEAGTSRAGGPGGYARAEEAAREFTAYFRREARGRSGDDRPGRDDLLTLLSRARAGGAPLTVEGIVGTCVHLLTAGHETTTNFLAKAVLALRAHPAVLAELTAAPELLPAAVEELLRYDPPVQAVTRWAYRDTALGGREVPRGSRVIALLGSANRDPGRFRDPDTLDVRRPADRHLAFGLGIHYCLGATLARAEAEIGLGKLLAGIPGLGAGLRRVDYADDMVFHGPKHLVLALPDAA